MRPLIALAALPIAAAALTALPAHAQPTRNAVPCIVNKDHAKLIWAGGQFTEYLNRGETFYVNDPTDTGWVWGDHHDPNGGSIEQMQRIDLNCPGD